MVCTVAICVLQIGLTWSVTGFRHDVSRPVESVCSSWAGDPRCQRVPCIHYVPWARISSSIAT